MSPAPGAVAITGPEQSSPLPSELVETPSGGATFRWSAALLLGGAGFLLNLLPVQLSPGTDMLFGGVFALLAGVVFGPMHGLLAGGIAGSRSLALWGHPWGWLLLTLEAGFVGLLAERRDTRPMVADLLFWAAVGAPVLFVASTLDLAYDLTTYAVVTLKQTLNGVFNAVLVELLLLIPFVRWVVRMPGSPGLRSAIAVVVTTAAILPALIFGIWVGRREWSRSLEAAEQRLTISSQAHASNLEQYVLLHENAIRSAALTSQQWDSFDSAHLQRMVSLLREQFPDFVQVYAANAHGVPVAAQPTSGMPGSPLAASGAGDSLYLARVRDMRRSLAPGVLHTSTGGDVPVVRIVHPLAHGDTFAGYILGALDLTALPEPNFQPRDYERLQVADGDGLLIFDSQDPLLAATPADPRADSVAFAAVTAGPVPATVAFTPGDTRGPNRLGARGHPEILAGVAAIPGLGWWVWMEEPVARIQGFIAESYLRLFGLLITVSLLALLLSTALARYLASPLLRMRSAAGALAEGDLVARVGRLPVAMPEEIRELGGGFDEMAAALTGRHEELEELGDIARSLASTLDLETLLPRITEAAERLVEPDGVGISLVSDAGTRLRAADYTLGMLADYAGQEIPMEASVAGWVTRHGRSLLIDETRTDSRVRGEDLDPSKVRSVICAPLLGRSGVLGALTAVRARTSDEVFDAEDLRLLERLAGNAAVAVENARLLEAAEAASRSKSAFIATMSHELRTPLNGVLGNLELLEIGIYGELSRKQQETIGRMQTATHQLRTLIEEVLSFSRLESGRMEMQLAETELWTLIQEVAAIIRPLAREKGLEFSMEDESREDERRTLVTDPEKVRQILIHLAGNAVKFTAEGAVSITLRQEAREASVRVSDTGVGISREDQRRLFRPFQQLDSGLSRAHGGAGLGLYLSGRYAELLGGRILVRSEPGEGSDFTLVLPMEQVHVRDDTWSAASTSLSAR